MIQKSMRSTKRAPKLKQSAQTEKKRKTKKKAKNKNKNKEKPSFASAFPHLTFHPSSFIRQTKAGLSFETKNCQKKNRGSWGDMW
jgi:hypothetical protein